MKQAGKLQRAGKIEANRENWSRQGKLKRAGGIEAGRENWSRQGKLQRAGKNWSGQGKLKRARKINKCYHFPWAYVFACKCYHVNILPRNMIQLHVEYYVMIIYRRTLFKCESLIIANCEFFSTITFKRTQ